MTSEVRHPERGEGSPEEDQPSQGEILRFAQRLFQNSGESVIPSVERGILVVAPVRFRKRGRRPDPSLDARDDTWFIRGFGRSAISTLAMTLLLAGGHLSAAADSPDVACISLCAERPAAQAQTRCLADELETAEEELEGLLTAAHKEWRYVPDDSIDPEMRAAADAFSKAIPESLDAAQKEWLEYVSADCGAAGAVWTNGSGRRPAVLVCRIDRVRRRSLDIWKVYLEPDAALPRPAQLCE